MSETQIQNYVGWGTHANRPSAPPTGTLPNVSYIYFEEDTGNAFIWDGNTSAWVQLNGGSGGGTDLYSWAAGIPALASFTQMNSSTATCSVISNGTTSISVVDTGANTTEACGMSLAVPGSTPYRVALFIQPDMPLLTAQFAGPYVGWTDGTKIDGLQFCTNGGTFGIAHTTFNSTGSRNSASALTALNFPQLSEGFWVGLHDDGTNVHMELSKTGAAQTFQTLYSVTKSSGFLGSSGYANTFWGLVPQDNVGVLAASLRCYDPNGLSRNVG